MQLNDHSASSIVPEPDTMMSDPTSTTSPGHGAASGSRVQSTLMLIWIRSLTLVLWMSVAGSASAVQELTTIALVGDQPAGALTAPIRSGC